MEEQAQPIIVNVDTGDETFETPDPEPTIVVVTEPAEEPAPEQVEVVEVPNPMLAVDNRFQLAEGRLDALEAQMIEYGTELQNRAVADHGHPVPSELAALSEHLDALKKEEVAPTRVRWYNRKLWG